VSGRDHAHKLPLEIWRERSEAVGLHLVPGSLNLAVDGSQAVLERLGKPDAVAHINSKYSKHPRKLWLVCVTGAPLPEAGVHAAVIENGMDDTLELVAEFSFKKDRGVKNGHELTVCAPQSP
jgi:hypothetical protein